MQPRLHRPKFRRVRVLLGAILLLTLFFYYYTSSFIPAMSKPIFSSLNGHSSPHDFALPKKPSGWYRDNCMTGASMPLGRNIAQLYAKMELIRKSEGEECKHIAEIFDSMFRFIKMHSTVRQTKSFREKAEGWQNHNKLPVDQVYEKDIYKIVNKWSNDETIYNSLRSKTPQLKPAKDSLSDIVDLTENSTPSCDFCSYNYYTAVDTFGRVNNLYSTSAENTFKLAKYGGLFFPNILHPFKISFNALSDIFINTTQQWFQKANDADKSQIYPTLSWDTFPHGEGTQVHSHIHGLLDKFQYGGLMENMHQTAQKYYEHHTRSYWTDIILIHWSLGLTVSSGSAVALVPLNAHKDHEYMVLSHHVNQDFVKLLYRIVEGYNNYLNIYCFSGAGVYPPIISADPFFNNDTHEMPVLFRMAARGDCRDVNSDVSSLELFTVSNINSNPEETYNSLEFGSYG